MTSTGKTMDNTTCLELALEGERLCKAGDCRAGVAFFEAAIQAGTDDLKTLSAIYSQLGNAYFYLGDYVKAMQYHKHDLTLARTMNDRLGEAKASGNLGNTLKVMGKFHEAAICCLRHLDISKELGDKVGEGRALYNLGNVYHAQGKHLGRGGMQSPGECPEEVKNCLQNAVRYYEENLKLMVTMSDRAAQGRACGNLGNTHYLLGNFSQAITYHQERLKIAREFGDKAAERRAHSNLGNAHVFLGAFEDAAEHYLKTLSLAQELSDRAVEAQACYSLGNTYTLLRDFTNAIMYHMRHLRIAQELQDKIGEGRACWSLGNAHVALGNHEKALHFANRHLDLSKEIGDKTGQVTAQMNLCDLHKAMGINNPQDSERARRVSMENMDLLKLTPDQKARGKEPGGTGRLSDTSSGLSTLTDTEEKGDEVEDFLDLLSRCQSKRLDDQRCSLVPPDGNKENQNTSNNSSRSSSDSGVSRESTTEGLSNRQFIKRLSLAAAESDSQPNFPDDSFFDMLMRCQGSRLEDQRSTLPPRAPTVPDEDFFSLIMRLQGGRLEDQRSRPPAAKSKEER